MPVAPVEPVSVTPESVDTPVVEATGPITFGPSTTFTELMSGRVRVETLRERDPNEYTNEYSVKPLDHDGLFYVFRMGTWKLIPGQAGSPPEQAQVYTWQQGYDAYAPATTAWRQPASVASPVESQPVETPQTRAERLARMAQLEKEIEELKTMAKEKSKDVQTN